MPVVFCVHDLRYSHDTTNLCPVLRRCFFFEEAVLIVKNLGVIYLYTHPRDSLWKYPYLSNTHNTFSCRLAIVHMVLEELRELRTYANCYKTKLKLYDHRICYSFWRCFSSSYHWNWTCLCICINMIIVLSKNTWRLHEVMMKSVLR